MADTVDDLSAPLGQKTERRKRRFRLPFTAMQGLAVLLGLVCIAALPRLTFDFNPLDLRSPRGEAVGTALDLMRDPATSPNTIDVVVPSDEAAQHVSAALSALPAVSSVVSVRSFIPDDQKAKLELGGENSDNTKFSSSNSGKCTRSFECVTFSYDASLEARPLVN